MAAIEKFDGERTKTSQELPYMNGSYSDQFDDMTRGNAPRAAGRHQHHVSIPRVKLLLTSINTLRIYSVEKQAHSPYNERIVFSIISQQ